MYFTSSVGLYQTDSGLWTSLIELLKVHYVGILKLARPFLQRFKGYMRKNQSLSCSDALSCSPAPCCSDAFPAVEPSRPS